MGQVQITPLSSHWEDVFHANLLAALSAISTGHELINHSFVLEPFTDIYDRAIKNPAREFRLEFTELMAQWTLTGQVQVSPEMLALNPNAAKFGTVFTARDGNQLCTAYGPRIVEQIPYVVRELQRDPKSRRACIMMLSSEDRFVAEALAYKETNCEYLCTLGFNFRIRNGALDIAVSMRSNNYATTVCQDVYVFSRLQQKVAELLELPVGRYYHSTVSGHIFPGEEDKAQRILHGYLSAIKAEHGDWLPHFWQHVCRSAGV